jgi:hypothetical protein
MAIFVLAAMMIAVLHLFAALQRPRAAVIVSGFLWAAYAYYEYLVASGVLCDADCNIRVDLVFFFPILGLATVCAYRAYNGHPGQLKIIAAALGGIALLAGGLVAETRGYGVSAWGLILAALALGLVYLIRSATRRPQR